jgi:hypothetical protein
VTLDLQTYARFADALAAGHGAYFAVLGDLAPHGPPGVKHVRRAADANRVTFHALDALRAHLAWRASPEYSRSSLPASVAAIERKRPLATIAPSHASIAPSHAPALQVHELFPQSVRAAISPRQTDVTDLPGDAGVVAEDGSALTSLVTPRLEDPAGLGAARGADKGFSFSDPAFLASFEGSPSFAHLYSARACGPP